MKSIYLSAISLLFALSACSLLENPEAYADKEDIFASEQGLEAYALSFYKQLPTLSSIPVCEASNVDYAACRSYSTFYIENSYSAETPTSWSWVNLRSVNYFIDGLNSPVCTVNEELKKAFRPEFLNRVDDIIVFAHLSTEEIRQIVDLMLKDLFKRLSERDLTIEVTDAAKDYLAKEGYSETYGARPLRRAIQTKIEDQLAEAVLDGKIKRGDTVSIRLKGKDIVFVVK